MDEKPKAKRASWKQAQAALFESEQRFRSLAENLGEGVAIVDPSETIIYCNPAAETIFGVGTGKLVGHNLFDFLSPEQRKIILQQTEVRISGQKSQYEVEITRADGKTRLLSVTATPWLDKEHQFIGSFGVFRDITETVIAEENLRQSEERYRAIVEDQSEMIFRFQSTGIITFANEAFCRFWQRKREAILGTNLMAYALREDRAMIRSQFTSLTPVCPAVTYEMRVIRPDGKTAWLQRTDRAIFDAEGKVTEYQCVCSDISERLIAEQALKHQLALEELVTEISTRFININPDEIETEIKRALKSLGEFSDVDRCFLIIFNPEGSTPEDGFEWVSERANLPRSLIQMGDEKISAWLLNLIRHKDLIAYSNLEHVPAEASAEREAWQKFGIKSLMALPLVIENTPAGIFGVSMELQEREWSPENHLMLRMIGEIFINILVREKNFQALHEAQSQLNQRIKELEQRSREISLLSEMSNMLQISNHVEEAYAIICQSTAHLFPNTSGCLYILEPRSGTLAIKGQWGAGSPQSRLHPEDCWGLRRGRLYRVAHAGLFCKHVSTRNSPSSTICVPISIQNKLAGLLHFQTHSPGFPLLESQQPLASAIAEQVGLALSNLQLREDLRQQAIRDHLTGLYNRYYMEASLEQELTRSQRSGKPVSLIMLDIDYFKVFNDTYQHQAGDDLLRELGHLMLNSIRSGDIACRYGGEEFLLILPETHLSTAMQRAEHLRLLVRGMRLESEHQTFPPITISLGVACWPTHGNSVNDLLKAADEAMYEAKGNGRDQVAAAK